MHYKIKTLDEIKAVCEQTPSGFEGLSKFFNNKMASECDTKVTDGEIASLHENGYFIRYCEYSNYFGTYSFTLDMLNSTAIGWLK